MCIEKNDENLNLILEVLGEDKEDKRQKVSTAKNLWITAINNFSKEFGNWEFVEITDPEDTKRL